MSRMLREIVGRGCQGMDVSMWMVYFHTSSEIEQVLNTLFSMFAMIPSLVQLIFLMGGYAK